jgi:hypothetical protein
VLEEEGAGCRQHTRTRERPRRMGHEDDASTKIDAYVDR